MKYSSFSTSLTTKQNNIAISSSKVGFPTLIAIDRERGFLAGSLSNRGVDFFLYFPK